MFGWRGKILIIDLVKKKWDLDEPGRQVYDKFIGGRGIAGFFIRPHIVKAWDHPEMPVIFAAGPLTATPSPASGRMTIMAKSPLTGTIGDSSVGGSLGFEIKKAGYDAIILTGKSNELVGIEIMDHQVSIRNAENFKGMGTEAVNAALKGKGARAVIGPAAENKVRFAGIIVDGGHAAGRGGIGLALAEKKVKYLTIKGSSRPEVYNPEMLKDASEDILRLVSASPALSGPLGISNFGTPALYDLMDARSMMPTANFTKTKFIDARSMNAHELKTGYSPSKTGCRGCYLRCKKIDSQGRALPEFETLSHFSALLNNNRLEVVIKANRICNDMGMDTISAAATLACYNEISKNSLTPDTICSMLKDIARARGIGKDLGLGASRYAIKQGRPGSAMAVKSQELSAYDPRGALGMALAFATSTRGACHLRAYPISHEILRKPVATDRFSFKGKARMIKIGEDINGVADSLLVCKFFLFAASLEEYSKVLHAVTGEPYASQDLMEIGERICFHERIMNSLNGFNINDDDLPPRFFKSKGTPCQGMEIPPIDRGKFIKARSDYYRIRGLDADGRPQKAKARELGLTHNMAASGQTLTQ